MKVWKELKLVMFDFSAITVAGDQMKRAKCVAMCNNGLPCHPAIDLLDVLVSLCTCNSLHVFFLFFFPFYPFPFLQVDRPVALKTS